MLGFLARLFPPLRAPAKYHLGAFQRRPAVHALRSELLVRAQLGMFAFVAFLPELLCLGLRNLLGTALQSRGCASLGHAAFVERDHFMIGDLTYHRVRSESRVDGEGPCGCYITGVFRCRCLYAEQQSQGRPSARCIQLCTWGS